LGQIDFISFLGLHCPICGGEGCYRAITPYWRYAIDLFPEFKKKRIPIARFLCRRHRVTFSLLPIQLIPYAQYTVGAVLGTLFLGIGYWQRGQKGFYGASGAIDPESLVTPWLIACWLEKVLGGLRRSHPGLRRLYHLDRVSTLEKSESWQEVAAYVAAFGLEPKTNPFRPLMDVIDRYSRSTGQFLFGTPSQYRRSVRA
jgi:hypothetical protein